MTGGNAARYTLQASSRKLQAKQPRNEIAPFLIFHFAFSISSLAVILNSFQDLSLAVVLNASCRL
jgi:hypothetical protein